MIAGVKPGDIINILVPSKSVLSSSNADNYASANDAISNQNSFWMIIWDIIQHLTHRFNYLNSKYKITDKLLIIAKPGNLYIITLYYHNYFSNF